MKTHSVIYQGDCLSMLKSLPSNSVHCVVTSPPYWAMRDYGVNGQIGLEPTFPEFINRLVVVFREIRRVLHKSGTLWVNMGDSYNSSATRGTFGDQSTHGYEAHGVRRTTIKGMHPKNRLGQPWKLAFALQDDGWILRDEIIWHKPNPMPASVDDRTTPAHEQLFLFAKSPIYYFDAWAIKEPASENTHGGGSRVPPKAAMNAAGSAQNASLASYITAYRPETRSKRSVWTIPTEAMPEGHFATYPQKLVEPCLLAGTSERGCCPTCLQPWRRVFEKVGVLRENMRNGFRSERDEKERPYIHNNAVNNGAVKPRKRADAPGAEVSPTSVFRTGEITVKKAIGWEQGCKCAADEPVPCTVLDPFSGSGTTGVVAAKLLRNYCGIELNPEYVEISRRRLSEGMSLFNEVEIIA